MMDSSLYFSENLVRALGWTLVHALWQGTAIAVALRLALPRFRSAQQRYWAAYAALLSLALAAAATFVWVYEPAKVVETIRPQAIWALPTSASDAILPPAAFWAGMTDRLEAYHPLIVALWLPGFLFFLFRLATGLHYIHRLRSRQTRPVPDGWQEHLQVLAARIGYSRPVVLLESARVCVPMALGYFKPLILLPIGLANQLAPAEVEAVLAHELAHIARRDWLFNLLQTLIEAVFYFHPAVWWMSATIRAERENCCDDTAVALTGNRLAYAKTLARLQELSRPAPTPALALGLSGATPLLRRRPLLLERIKRILHQPQQHVTAMEKTIALALLAALFALLTLRANTPPALTETLRDIAETPKTWLTAAAPQAFQSWQTPADTVPAPKKERRKIVHDDGDQRVEIELEAEKIQRLVIDGKEVPAAEYAKYGTLTKQIVRDATPPPAPPAPPTPAMPGAPAWAPEPPAAPRAWDAPAPPRAPFPPRASSITTDIDDQGNTIIRLEQNGMPMEIQVRDGDVWVDGKRLEQGETLEIPGIQIMPGNERIFQVEGDRLYSRHRDGRVLELSMPPAPDALPPSFYFNLDGPNVYFETPEGTGLQIREIFPALDAKRLREQALREVEHQRRQIERELRDTERLYRTESSRAQKEARRAQEDIRQAQEEARKAQEEVRRELDRALHAQHLALEKELAAAEALKSRSRWASSEHQVRFREQYAVVGILENSLLRDKLIADPNNFSMELSAKALRVNGKKLPDATHKRYLELYQSKSGKELGKKDNIHIEMKAGQRTFGWNR